MNPSAAPDGRYFLIGSQVDSKANEGTSPQPPADLKSYDWPLAVVPMKDAQVAAEIAAATSVDLADAVKACAPDLVVTTAAAALNGGGEVGSGLPNVVEIENLKEFKQRVLFPHRA